MEKRDKGIHRGGASGMEGELGEKSVDMDKEQKRGASRQQQGPDNPGRKTPGSGGQQNPDKGGRKAPGSGDLNDRGLEPDLPNDRSRSRPLGETGLDQGAQQRGGLRREPDLEGAEEATGHETD